MSYREHEISWVSFIIRTYRPSLLVCSLNWIQCPPWADRPILAPSYVGVHKRTLLTRSTLLFQQCPLCSGCFTWIVCKMGDKWLYSCYFFGCCFQELLKTARSLFVNTLSFFSVFFLSSGVWQYSSIDTDWKNSHFIQSEGLYFHQIDNLSITVHVLPMHLLISVSVDEILLLMYVKWSTNFRDLQF